MPIDANRFNKLLKETKYNKEKRKFLIDGFKNGFDLQFSGDRKVTRMAPNLKLRVGNKTDLWNKVMKEVKAKRYAGPFDQVPYENFIQLLIGLVPKDHGKKT